MWNYIPSFAQLGIISVPLDTREAMREFSDSVEAKCLECGSSFQYDRGQGLACPYCAADFKVAHFGRDRRRVEFEGKKVAGS